MSEPRSAQALWITAPGHAEVRETPFETPHGYAVIDTLFTGISRGTERLVFEGRVPESEHTTMRAPFQEGAFPGPLKYGYAAVGRVAETDSIVFALFPHQTSFAVPSECAIPVPETVPPERAVLAANMETALNILWDAGIQAGDRLAVVGCGVVGALVGYLAARIPGTEVCMIDIDPARRSLADALGCTFAAPGEASGDADVAIHASATAAGLATAISLAGVEAAIVEASWYGTGTVQAPLGGRFHQRRLRIVGSQVGRIPPGHAARWTYRRRLEKALDLLADPALDALISGDTHFSELGRSYESILTDPGTLCHRVRFGG
jgi:hypothetical protein